jgi:hypothetical protein
VGPPDPRATWITTNQAGSGFLGTLDTVPASLASRPPGPGMHTIAAHAAHLGYAMSLAVRAMRGENPYAAADWAGSWKKQSVDELGWAALRAELRRLHGELSAAIRAAPSWSDPDLLKGTMGLVGHGSYHLGAMRTIHHHLLLAKGT